MKNILKEAKGTTITLKDGKKYNLSPIDLTTLSDLEDEFDGSLSLLEERFNKKPMSAMRIVLHTLLKENYPEITLREAGHLVTPEAIGEVTKTLLALISNIE